MERLKGKEILIGREPQKRRLLISVKDGSQIKMGTIGSEGSVPNCVSCCKPGENIAHCKISVGMDGTIIIHNLKPQNVTYVNNIEVVDRILSEKCDVSLGSDKYSIDTSKVLDMAQNMLVQGGGPGSGHSIRHLQRVWEEYDNALYELQKRQKNLGLIKSLYMPCTVLTGLMGFIFKSMGVENENSETVSMVMYIIAAVILFYGLYRTVTDKSLEERKELDKKFQKDYVCPKCKHFLGVKPYEILRQDKFCPYNKCEWAE